MTNPNITSPSASPPAAAPGPVRPGATAESPPPPDNQPSDRAAIRHADSPASDAMEPKFVQFGHPAGTVQCHVVGAEVPTRRAGIAAVQPQGPARKRRRVKSLVRERSRMAQRTIKRGVTRLMNAMAKLSWQAGLAILNLRILASCVSRLEWLQLANLVGLSNPELSRLLLEMAECMAKVEDLTQLSPDELLRLDDRVRVVARDLDKAFRVHLGRPPATERPTVKVKWSTPVPRAEPDNEAEQATPDQILQAPTGLPIQKRQVAVRQQS